MCLIDLNAIRFYNISFSTTHLHCRNWLKRNAFRFLCIAVDLLNMHCQQTQDRRILIDSSLITQYDFLKMFQPFHLMLTLPIWKQNGCCLTDKLKKSNSLLLWTYCVAFLISLANICSFYDIWLPGIKKFPYGSQKGQFTCAMLVLRTNHGQNNRLIL